MGSISRLLGTAAVRRIVPTDLAAGTLGAITIGAGFAGMRLPADAAGITVLGLAVTFVSVVALRLLAALQAMQRSDPAPAAKGARRRDRAFLERAYQSARADIACDFELYLEPMSQAFVMTHFSVETIARLNRRAAPFLADRRFALLWPRFVSQFEHEARVAYHDLDRELDEEAAIQLSRNLNHCLAVRRAIVQALIECLRERHGFEARLDARLAEIDKDFSALGMADLFVGSPPEPSSPP